MSRPPMPASWRFPAGPGVFFLSKGRVWPALPAWLVRGAGEAPARRHGAGAHTLCLTGTHTPRLTGTHRLYQADSGPFPRRNPASRSGEVLVLGIMKYADLDVLKYVIHAKEYHVHEERRDGASPARRTRERRWRACSAVVAGMLLLAVG